MSNSLERFSRQLGLLNQDWFLTNRVSVIGVGNLGTPLCLNLSKAGFREIYVYDPDTIEAHNIPNQMYSAHSLRRTKISQILLTMDQYAPALHTYWGIRRKVRLEDPLLLESEIMIVLTDSIESRIESFLLALMYKYKAKYNIKYLIEAGTHAHSSKLFVVNLDSVQQRNVYFESLLERHKTPSADLPCTERSTFFYASFIASVIMGYLRNLSEKEKVPFETWIDLKNSQVIQFDKVKTANQHWSLLKMFVAYDDDYNDKRLKQLTRIVQYDSPFSQTRFNDICQEYQIHGGENNFSWFLSSLMNISKRTEVIDDFFIRVKLKRGRRVHETDFNCHTCACDRCKDKYTCDKAPCDRMGGCNKKGAKHGRVVYCKSQRTEGGGSMEFIAKAMEGKKLIHFDNAMKTFIRKWSGFEF